MQLANMTYNELYNLAYDTDNELALLLHNLTIDAYIEEQEDIESKRNDGDFPVMDDKSKSEVALHLLDSSKWIKIENKTTKRNDYVFEEFYTESNIYNNGITLQCVGKGIYDVEIMHSCYGEQAVRFKMIDGLENAKAIAIENAMKLVIEGKLCF